MKIQILKINKIECLNISVMFQQVNLILFHIENFKTSAIFLYFERP